MTLTYHDVADDDGPHSGFVGTGPDHYRLTPSVFARHLDAIASSGIAPSLVTDARDEHRRVYLTFDDGGSSAVTAIAPMLVERGWRGHFFVTTDRIGSPGFLTPGEVRELSAHGHVIGSHGHTHRMLTTLSQAEVADEWRRSRALLEDLLGQPLISVSVPTGAYSGTIGRLAAEAGYRHVFTSEPWLRPRRVGGSWIYGRFAIVHDTPPQLVNALCRFSRPAMLREGSRWHARKAAKVALGRRYETLRVALLERRQRL